MTSFSISFGDIKSGIRHLTCGAHSSAYIFSFLLSVSLFVRTHHYCELSRAGLGIDRPSWQWPVGLGLSLAYAKAGPCACTSGTTARVAADRRGARTRADLVQRRDEAELGHMCGGGAELGPERVLTVVNIQHKHQYNLYKHMNTITNIGFGV